MNPDVRALKPYPMAQLQQRKAELRAKGTELFDFGTGDPIEPTPAFIREAAAAAIPEISQYPSVRGSDELREAAAAYLKRRFAVQLDPQRNIIPSAGSKEAIFHLPLAFLDPGSERNTVIFGAPAYPVYNNGTLFAGGRVHSITLNAATGFRLDLTALPNEVLRRTCIAWFNYPHNPTGACVDERYLAEQLACCREHGIIAASDECYTDLWFDDRSPPPPSMLQCGTDGVLVFQSCSKRSGMTGYRSGFVAGDPTLIAEYLRWRANFGVGSQVFVDAAAAAAWSDDAHPAERRAAFAAKRSVICDGFAERGIEVLPSEAGLYVWARVPGDGDADAYAQRCLERGIVISPGGFFGDGGEGWFRASLVPTVEDCRRALSVWPD